LKKLIFLSTLLVLLLASSCVIAPVVPPLGGIYSSIEAPLDIDIDKTTIGSKQGEAHCTSIFWLVAFGDCSTQRAAQNGNIQNINHADYSFTNILLGIYQSLTVKVYGD
jgi:hypothetical protein